MKRCREKAGGWNLGKVCSRTLSLRVCKLQPRSQGQPAVFRMVHELQRVPAYFNGKKNQRKKNVLCYMEIM